MSSARTALRERVAALAQARRAFDSGRLEDAERILQDELSRWPGNRDAQTLLAEVTRKRGGTPGRATPAARPPARPRAAGPEAWNSFEARIRDRKVARLADRARAALAAGSATEALALVDEIEAIAPGHPVIEELSLPTTAQVPSVAAQAAPVLKVPASPLDRWPPDVVVEPVADETAVEPPHPLEVADLRIEPLHNADAIRQPLGDVDTGAGPAPTVDRVRAPRPEGGAPIRERGTFAIGMFLLVASVLALSGIAGYWWFTPARSTTPPAADTAQAGRDAAARTPPPVSDSTSPPGTGGQGFGTAEGRSPDPPQPLASSSKPAPLAPAPVAPAPTPVDPPPTLTARNETSRDTSRRETVSRPPDTRGESSERAEPPRAEPPAPRETQAPVAPPTSPPAEPAAPSTSTTPPAATPSEPPASAAPPPAATAPESAAADSKSETAAGESNAPDDTPRADADAMRGLIEGYLAGYNNLDAGGVRAVWPAVDHRALARAFGQLASQRLVFSRCEVRGESDEGHGFCIGRATWRPRVGGGERNERRVWRFDFEQRNGRWAIDGVAIER